MALQITALAALPVVLCSDSALTWNDGATPFPRNPVPFSDLQMYCMYKMYKHTHRQDSQTHKIKIKNLRTKKLNMCGDRSGNVEAGGRG